MRYHFVLISSSLAVIAAFFIGFAVHDGTLVGQGLADLNATYPTLSTLSSSSSPSSPASSLPTCSDANLNAFTNAITAAINATSSAVITGTTTPSIYQYRYLTGADECALNQLGRQGWSVFNMGSIQSDSSGGPYYLADCRTPTHNYIDWIVMERLR